MVDWMTSNLPETEKAPQPIGAAAAAATSTAPATPLSSHSSLSSSANNKTFGDGIEQQEDSIIDVSREDAHSAKEKRWSSPQYKKKKRRMKAKRRASTGATAGTEVTVQQRQGRQDFGQREHRSAEFPAPSSALDRSVNESLPSGSFHGVPSPTRSSNSRRRRRRHSMTMMTTQNNQISGLDLDCSNHTTSGPSYVTGTGTVSVSSNRSRKNRRRRSSLGEDVAVFTPLTTRASMLMQKTVRDATNELTVNKLRIDSLTICGRSTERQQLEIALRQTVATAAAAASAAEQAPSTTAKTPSPSRRASTTHVTMKSTLEGMEQRTKTTSSISQFSASKRATSLTPLPPTTQFDVPTNSIERNQQGTKKNMRQFVAVSGYSGTGKSSLVSSALKDMVRQQFSGAFVIGKFDQMLVGGGGNGNAALRSSGSLGRSSRGFGGRLTRSNSLCAMGQQRRPFSAFGTICDELAREIDSWKRSSLSASRRSDDFVDDFAGDSEETSRPSFDSFKERITLELGRELLDLIQVFPSLGVILSNRHHQLRRTRSAMGWDQQQEMFQPKSNVNSRSSGGGGGGGDSSNGGGVVTLENRTRLSYAFRLLIRIISSALSPLVMVLDDLQWADPASLDLLEGLLCDRENKNLMIVGIYRSNEVDGTHPLSHALQRIRNRGREHNLSTTEICMENLDIGAVNELVQAMLAVDNDDRVRGLAEICFKKTGGNPFHVIHFMSMLHDNHLLEFNLGLMKWKWDVDEIEFFTKATQNVVDILKEQMTCLSSDNQRLLQYAAYLGSVFDTQSMFVLWRDFHNRSCYHDVNETIHEDNNDASAVPALDDDRARELLEGCLTSCEQAGFLEATGEEGTYRWVHDKLQEAAMDLVPVEKQGEFSQQVAEVLGSQLSDQELESAIFVVANRYNEGEMPAGREKRIQLARLNLRAANKAVAYSAFESAATYCEYGISMLSDDCWEDEYHLSLDLFSLGAETEGFLGNIERMEYYCDEVFRNVSETTPQTLLALHKVSPKISPARSSSGNGRRGGVRDKLRACHVMMKSISNRYRFKEAADLCLEILKEYGTTFPKGKTGIACRIVYNVMKIKSAVKKRTLEEVNNLPVMEASRIEQMELMDKLATYLYNLQHDLLPLVIFKSLHWTLEYGVCIHACPAFATTGLILAGVVKDVYAGAVYANYGLMLLAKLDAESSKRVESRTLFIIYGFVLPWTQPLGSMSKPLLQGYEVGLRTGDSESAMYCIFFYMFDSFVLGRKLATIDADCQTYIVQMEELKQGPAGSYSKILRQMILNLMGESNLKTKLTGEVFDEEAWREQGGTNTLVTEVLNANVQVVSSFFGEYGSGAELAYRRGDSFEQSSPASPLVPPDAFHRCLSLLAMARKQKEKGNSVAVLSRGMEAKYVKSAKSVLSKIKGWVSQGNPNVRHYEAILDAELAAYEGQTEVAKQRYKAAVVLASRSGFIHDAALANERYGIFLFSLRGRSSSVDLMDAVATREEGCFRLEESMKLYREWGAHAKVECLEAEFGTLLI